MHEKIQLIIVFTLLIIGSFIIPIISSDMVFDGGEWSSLDVISVDSFSDSKNPSLSVDPDGLVEVVWSDKTNILNSGSDFDIYYKKKSEDGNWSDVELVSTESSGNSYDAKVVDFKGVVHVAWRDESSYGGSTASRGVFYKKRSVNGVWSITEVVSKNASDVFSFSMDVDSNGTVHLTLSDKTGDDYDVYYSKRPSNSIWTDLDLVSGESSEHSFYSSIAVDSDQMVHVVWSDKTNYDGSGNDYDIFYKTKQDGGIWSNAEIVTSDSTVRSHYPSLDVDHNNAVHMVWVEDGVSGLDPDVYYVEKDSSGSWDDIELVSTESTDDSKEPILCVDSNDVIHVTWYDSTDYNGSNSDWDVFYKSRLDTGRWNNMELVSVESTDDSRQPSLSVFNYSVHIAWYDNTNYDGCGIDWDVFYKSKKYDITEVSDNSEDFNYPPLADAGGPYEGYVNELITFDGSASFDPDGSIVRYIWDFGDLTFGYGSSASVDHTYVLPDVYEVKLRVFDNDGLSGFHSVEVNVLQQEDNYDATSFSSTLFSSGSLQLAEGINIYAEYTVDAAMSLSSGYNTPGGEKDCKITLNNGLIKLTVVIDKWGIKKTGTLSQSLPIGSSLELLIPDMDNMVSVPVSVNITADDIRGSDILSFESESIKFNSEGTKSVKMNILDSASHGDNFEFFSDISIELDLGLLSDVPAMGEQIIPKDFFPMSTMEPTLEVSGLITTPSLNLGDGDIGKRIEYIVVVLLILIIVSIALFVLFIISGR